jgi:hypothetical protein
MKALTIKNPWAYLICIGQKDVENRTWHTKFRGRVLIHSAAKEDMKKNVPLILNFSPNSAIIGSVEIIDCIRDFNSEWAFPEYWHWILRDAELFKNPILGIKGSLSFWNIPEGICISV